MYWNRDIQQAMNIHHFEEIMKRFKSVESESGPAGSGGFDAKQFSAVFRSILGNSLSDEQMQLLFMKIDANSDGTIDWDEFSTYMMTGASESNERVQELYTGRVNLNTAARIDAYLQ
jgi:hypothetical protein